MTCLAALVNTNKIGFYFDENSSDTVRMQQTPKILMIGTVLATQKSHTTEQPVILNSLCSSQVLNFTQWY
jgi:hypothetical protein